MQGQWYNSEIKHTQPRRWVGSEKGDRVRIGRGGRPTFRYGAIISEAEAPPKVGLIWSAKDRRVEKGGLAPPKTKHGGTAARGGRQPRYALCTTTTSRAVSSHTQIYRECGSIRQFGLLFEKGSRNRTGTSPGIN